MKSRSGVRLGVLLAGLLWLGCPDPEAQDLNKIGRYVFTVSEAGLEVRESSDWLVRLFERLRGAPREAKLRVGRFSDGENDFAPQQIADALVRKRAIMGPEAKRQGLARRPWEARLLSPSQQELPPFFLFGSERDAHAFANELRRQLARLKTQQAS